MNESGTARERSAAVVTPRPRDCLMFERSHLSNGQVVSLRRAAPEDFDAVRDFYRALDDDSKYFRFFGIRRELPPAELCEVVGASASHVTVLATVGGRLIGLGEYITGTELDAAEIAFTVADDHHRQGVATLLLERLAIIAHAHGVRRFTAIVLPDNGDMQLVFRTVGLTTRTTLEDGVVNVTLDLTSLPAMRDAAQLRAQPKTVASDAQAIPLASTASMITNLIEV